jgi:hypothetical protein
VSLVSLVSLVSYSRADKNTKTHLLGAGIASVDGGLRGDVEYLAEEGGACVTCATLCSATHWQHISNTLGGACVTCVRHCACDTVRASRTLIYAAHDTLPHECEGAGQ